MAAGRFTLGTGDDDVHEQKTADGITILNFGPGHTFGMMGLLVELKNSGNIILASDTINTAVNYGPPIRYPGLAYDTIGYLKRSGDLLPFPRKKRHRFFFGHDIKQFEDLKKAPDAYYD